MPSPDLSIIIPYYRRADTIAHTLRSLDLARRGLDLEIILVDDGSPEPFSTVAPPSALATVTRLLRQPNQGLLFARLAGLAAASADHVLFLDSDDLVGPDKLTAQLDAMRASAADVSYTDSASIHLPPDPDQPRLHSPAYTALTHDPLDLYLRIQPAPHNPVFRTAYLRDIVASPICPPLPAYNPVAEIWFYYNAAARPARIVKAPGLHTWVGIHPGSRLSNHWEKLGFASASLATDFFAACPRTPATLPLLQALSTSAFQAWRATPHDYCPPYRQRLLDLWKIAPVPASALPGGPRFRLLARLLGPITASRLLARLRPRPYSACRTLDDTALQTLVDSLPPLPKSP